MKRTIRALLKIPVTPLIVAWSVMLLLVFYVVRFGQWLYEANDWDKSITQDIIDKQYELLKLWFTSI